MAMFSWIEKEKKIERKKESRHYQCWWNGTKRCTSVYTNGYKNEYKDKRCCTELLETGNTGFVNGSWREPDELCLGFSHNSSVATRSEIGPGSLATTTLSGNVQRVETTASRG